MLIAYDATAMPAQRAGAGVYTFELIQALTALETDHWFVVFQRGAALDSLAGRPQVRLVSVPARSRPARLTWEQTALPLQLRRLGAAVFHSPHHTLPLLPSRCPRVVTVHDVTFLLLPERYPPVRRLYFRLLTWASARAAAAVIVPSNAVKADVCRMLGVPAAQVTVVAEAAAERYRPQQDPGEIDRVRRTYQLEGPYLLSVGSLEPGKNRRRLVEAFASLAAAFPHTLAIAGRPAWKFEEELSLPARIGLVDRVRFLGYVPDADMPALYGGADAVAFPSLYEGFGLPALEAMACGTPLLTSTAPALAELVGGAALLVDPYDTAAIASGLRRLLSDPALRDDLRRRGLERAASFSWRQTARETLAVYERVAASRPTRARVGGGRDSSPA